MGSVNTYDPKLGKRKISIKHNITFEPDMFFTQERNGWEVLSTLIYKVFNQEELSDEEAIDLLILPDMDIDMPIETLMKISKMTLSFAKLWCLKDFSIVKNGWKWLIC